MQIKVRRIRFEKEIKRDSTYSRKKRYNGWIIQKKMIFSWDAMLIAGSLLIVAWVIFYRWKLQERKA